MTNRLGPADEAVLVSYMDDRQKKGDEAAKSMWNSELRELERDPKYKQQVYAELRKADPQAAEDLINAHISDDGSIDFNAKTPTGDAGTNQGDGKGTKTSSPHAKDPAAENGSEDPTNGLESLPRIESPPRWDPSAPTAHDLITVSSDGSPQLEYHDHIANHSKPTLF